MQSVRQYINNVANIFRKNKRPLILVSLAVLAVLFLFFRQYILQLILVLFVIACLGYVAYKTVIYVFVIGFSLLRGILIFLAIFFAVFGIIALLGHITV